MRQSPRWLARLPRLFQDRASGESWLFARLARYAVEFVPPSISLACAPFLSVAVFEFQGARANKESARFMLWVSAIPARHPSSVKPTRSVT